MEGKEDDALRHRVAPKRLHETDIEKWDQHVRKCENKADYERIMETTSRSSTKVSSNTKVDSETQGQPGDSGRAAKGLLTHIDRERQVCAYKEMLARTCPSSNNCRYTRSGTGCYEERCWYCYSGVEINTTDATLTRGLFVRGIDWVSS